MHGKVAKLGAFTSNCPLNGVPGCLSWRSVELQDGSGEDGGLDSLSLELPTDPPAELPLRLVCCSNLSTEKDKGNTGCWM